MKSKYQLLLAFTLVLALIAGCGPTEEPAQEEVEGDVAEEVTEETPAAVESTEPADVAQNVYNLYEDGLIRATALVKEVEDPAAQKNVLKEQLYDLKEELINKLVAHGHIIAQYDDAQMEAFTTQLNANIGSVPDELFKGYEEALQRVWDDEELRVVMRSFNIITQYSQFDLLQEQEPEEFERLNLGQ